MKKTQMFLLSQKNYFPKLMNNSQGRNNKNQNHNMFCNHNQTLLLFHVSECLPVPLLLPWSPTASPTKHLHVDCKGNTALLYDITVIIFCNA